MRVLTLLAFVALLVSPAVAGTSEGDCGLCGFACENMCPLAHQANAWRATGTEALAVDSTVHHDLVTLVRRNLGKI